MRIKRFLESHSDPGISELEDLFSDLNEEFNVKNIKAINDFNLDEICWTLFPTQTKPIPWFDDAISSFCRNDALKNNVYVVEIEGNVSFLNVRDTLNRCEKYGDFILSSRNFTNRSTTKLILVRNKSEIIRRILSYQQGVSIKESKVGVDDTISTIQDIFADVSDELDTNVKYLDITSSIFSMIELILPEESIRITREWEDSDESDAYFYDFCIEILENKVYKVNINGVISDPKLKEIEVRSAYYNLHIIKYTPFADKSFIIFVKDKEEIIKKILSYEFNKMNESKSEIENSILELEDIFVNISDEKEVIIENKRVVGNIMNVLLRLELSSIQLDDISKNARYYTFCESLLEGRIYTVLVSGGIKDKRIKEITTRCFHQDFHLITKRIYMQGGYTTLEFVKNKDEIVQKITQYRVTRFINESKEDDTSQLQDVFNDISDSATVNIEVYSDFIVEKVIRGMSSMSYIDVSHIDKLDKNDFFSYCGSVLEGNVYLVDIKGVVSDDDLLMAINRCSKYGVFNFLYVMHNLQKRTSLVFLKNKDEVVSKIKLYKSSCINESKENDDISDLEDLFADISDREGINISINKFHCGFFDIGVLYYLVPFIKTIEMIRKANIDCGSILNDNLYRVDVTGKGIKIEEIIDVERRCGRYGPFSFLFKNSTSSLEHTIVLIKNKEKLVQQILLELNDKSKVKSLDKPTPFKRIKKFLKF